MAALCSAPPGLRPIGGNVFGGNPFGAQPPWVQWERDLRVQRHFARFMTHLNGGGGFAQR
jgi:hypothetical protein